MAQRNPESFRCQSRNRSSRDTGPAHLPAYGTLGVSGCFPLGFGRIRRQTEFAVQTIFVLIKCELGKAYEVADQTVENVPEVSEVHSLSLIHI